MSYTLSVAVPADAIATGESYAFRSVAVNSKGASLPSLELIAAVAAPLSQPAAPTRNLPLSSRTHVFIEWSAATASEIEVRGYLLYMSTGYTGDYQLAHNGTYNAL